MFYITMFICNMLMPLSMILSGYMMYKYTSKEINSIIGYRTKRSSKNLETWKFANSYCGKLWIKQGIILLILSCIVQLPFAKSNVDVIGKMTTIIETIQIVVMLASIGLVEKALKRKFD